MKFIGIEAPPDKQILKALISENIKDLRKKYGLTQEDLAELTGLSRVSIARYENCQHSITLENVLIIAKALDESPLAIIDGWELSL